MTWYNDLHVLLLSQLKFERMRWLTLMKVPNRQWVQFTAWTTMIASVVLLPISIGLAGDRPNILWIIADDLSPDLGCYGYEGVNTPHIDRLAGRGRRYTAAFATAPVCSSSRSALITGVYQTTTGTHQHRTPDKSPLAAPVEPIPELLRQAGYFTCNSNASMSRAGKEDYNFAISGDLYDGVDWSVRDGGRRPGQPFFAQVQIHEPHRDFVVATDPDRFRETQIPTYYPNHAVIRADWANYLASIEVLDRKVGAVLNRLEREGLVENTIIFFFGDHGRPHYRDKQWLYDGGIRTPLIVCGPGRIQPGVVRDELVSLIDVSAATVALAGVAIPSWMQGQDMLAEDFVGRTRVFAARDRCGSTVDRIRAVRTQRFKYIRNFYPERPYSQHSGYKVLQYPGLTVANALYKRGQLPEPANLFWSSSRPAEELYDLSTDPDEIKNLANDPQLAPTLATLRQELDDWIRESGDQGRFPEEAEQAAIEASENWYEGRMKKRGLASQPHPEDYLRWWEDQLGINETE